MRSVSRTYGITCRLSSVAMYSISLATFMCQWMPCAVPSRSLPPPTCTCSVVTDSVFFSSSAYSAMRDDLVAVELLRPVALLAGVARRPQVLHRRRNRPRVGVERDGEQLPRARELRSREPRRAGADVALHAGDARVRAVLVRGELRLHHLVADLAAELDRVHVLDAAIGRERHDDDVGHVSAKMSTARAALVRVVEIDARPAQLDGALPAPPPAALEPGAERNQQKAEHEDRPAGSGRTRCRCRGWCAGRTGRRERRPGTGRR